MRGPVFRLHLAPCSRQLWTLALGVGLVLLTLLTGSRSLAKVPSPIPNTCTALRMQCRCLQPPTSNPWHVVYLPLVVSQPPAVPLYSLTVAPGDLAWLYENWWTDDTVPAIFTYDGVSYKVDVRFRGGTVRNLPKKSWKIKFPAATPFQGQRELNLNAEYTDKSLLREMLAYDLFARAGLIASRASFARLQVNGEYMGVFVQVEQVDQRFLERVGLDPNGNLYKGNYGNFEESSDYQAYQNSYLKKTNRQDSHDDIIAFIEAINPEAEAEFLASVMDVGAYLDWFTVQVLLGNYEWLEKNYYFHHDLSQDWWTFTPWDLDLLLGHNWSWQNDILDPDISWDNPIDTGTLSSPKADGKWNKLITEVLRHEAFRFAYCRRLAEMMHDEFSESVMSAHIDAFYAQIAPYAETDPYKWGTNADFHAGPDELKTYVSNRIAWLTDRIPEYCPTSGTMPLINELMSDNQTTLTDEKGEHEPWIELYNPGLVSFDAGGMTLRATTTLTTPAEWTLPDDALIPAGGFILIWADGEPGDGPLHASFRLATDGGALTLLDKAVHGGRVVESRVYGPLAADLSFGRITDGGEGWITFRPATPGWSNLGRAPVISATTQAPAEPDAGQVVTVSAVVTAVNEPLTVTLRWSVGGVEQSAPMSVDGDGRFSATIPAHSAGDLISYAVQAVDAASLSGSSPTHSYIVGFHRPPLYLNELVAINQDTLADAAGEHDDWFEIYNAGTVTVALGGMYLTDAIENTTRWQIPAGVQVAPGGYLVFWADGQSEQGPVHAGFKLNGDGERLALYASLDNYNGLIDEIYYGPQTVDQPWGRYPDAGDIWRAVVPTPGETNRQPPPAVSHLTHAPAVPVAGQPVNVTAVITDERAVLSATLHYDAGAGFVAVPMEVIAGVVYGGQIPGQPDGIAVRYYLTARDDEGELSIYPQDAPAVTYGYRVGDALPPLFINEFLASNASVNTDEAGEYEDWIELYNAGDTPLDLGGMYLTDDLSRPTRWRIPDGTVIPAGGFALIWADDDGADGPLHTNFHLSKEGEEIGLFDRDGARIDSIVFGLQTTDVSIGRTPDGGPRWIPFDPPTPASSNHALNMTTASGD